MFGKIIDLNSTDAFIEVSNSFIINVPITALPSNPSIGDNINMSKIGNNNDKIIAVNNFF